MLAAMELSAISSICIFGDSVVYAHTDATAGGWPGRLKRASTEAGVTNAVYALGIPGNKLRDVAARFEGEAAARHPDLVILAAGAADSPNDFTEATPVEVFQQDYQALIATARTITPHLVALTPVNIDEERETFGFANATPQPYVDSIRSLALKEQVACVDVFGAFSGSDFDNDGVHPTASGHEKIFERVRAAISAL
jgi:lysophospholipase L1-like esterase